MFTRLIHLVMCLTVLVCPAMGGVCCGVPDVLVEAVDGCEAHCSCGAEHEQAPMVPDCPEPCQDCFCAGALPPGFGASVELDGMADIPVLAPFEHLAAPIGTHRLGSASQDESPPHGRMLLTSYCRFLL